MDIMKSQLAEIGEAIADELSAASKSRDHLVDISETELLARAVQPEKETIVDMLCQSLERVPTFGHFLVFFKHIFSTCLAF